MRSLTVKTYVQQREHMNIFIRELRAHRKNLFFWCVGMLFLVISGVAKFYGYSTSGESTINNVLDMFPKSLQVLFGLNGFDLSQASGAYGILFMYLAIMAAVHAVLLGNDLLAKEERDKTSEFLLVKPVSRADIISSKLSAGIINLVALNFVTLFSSLYTMQYFSHNTSANKAVGLLCVALLILQLIFFSVGAVIAAIGVKPKASAGAATAVLLFTFALSFAINLSGHINGLQYFTPFKYFEAQTILANNHLDAFYTTLSVALIVSMGGTMYFFYKKRDMRT